MFIPVIILIALIVAIVFAVRHFSRSNAQNNAVQTGPVAQAPLRSAIADEDSSSSAAPTPTRIPVPDTRVRIETPAVPEADSSESSEETAASLVAEGDQHKANGDYDDAISSYEAAADAYTEESGRESLAFADILVKVEDAYYARDCQTGDDSGEEPTCNGYLRGLSIYEHCCGVFSPKLVPIIDKIVAFYMLVGKQSEADALIRRRQLIEQRNETAAAEWQQKLDAAESAGQPKPTLERSLTITAPSILAAHAAMRSPMESGSREADETTAAGDTARSENDYETAIENYEAAAETISNTFGGDSVKLVPLLVRIGEVYHVRDILEEDEEGLPDSTPFDNMSLALSLIIRDGGPMDVRQVPVLINLAAYCDQAGDHYKADRYISMIDTINENERRKASK